MRIINRIDAERDVTMYFALGQSETTEQLLYERWLKTAWLKHLFKTDPGWVWPVQVQKLPSFFIEDVPSAPKLFVDLPRFGATTIVAESEWDAKDAEAGTLFYYKPVHSTMAPYVQQMTQLRDYLCAEVFPGKGLDFDVRKYSYTQVQEAARQWHEAFQERMRREAEARAERERKGIQISVEPPNWTNDWLRIKEFESTGQKYVVCRLMSHKSLDYETERMHHCIYSYKDRLFNSGTVLLSVRKANDLEAPIVSAEFSCYPTANGRSITLIQVQGPCNHPADTFIPGVTKEMMKFLAHADDPMFAPIHPPSTDQSYEVKLN